VGTLAPAVAAVRVAVRRAISRVPRQRPLVLVACSGGADSLALAAATAFVAPRSGLRHGFVTIDHRLQEGSSERAAQLVKWATGEGFVPAVAAPVEVAGRPGGPEAAAREARYEALAGIAERACAGAVLLGHTRDDQAETVLLALARGAGPRGLAGMPARRIIGGVTFLRPFLEVSRAQTRAACAALKLEPWHDPHNVDPAYARSRVRALLPALVEALGPGVVANLARTAALVAADSEALDALAANAAEDAANSDGSLHVPALVGLPDALRTRVLHGWLRSLGVPGSALGHGHVAALDALLTDWHGQGPVALPGGVRVARRGERVYRVPGFPSRACDDWPGVREG
jgi:tRNA(Ile)-lysidine synthase